MASVSTWERIERRKLHQWERWKRPARPGDRPPRPAPAPQLRGDQGARRPRTVSRGIPDPHFPQITAELEPGNVLLLHTDGLTERNPHLRDEAELQALLTSVDGHDAHEILEQIERQSLGPEPRRLADDVAILLFACTEPLGYLTPARLAPRLQLRENVLMPLTGAMWSGIGDWRRSPQV